MAWRPIEEIPDEQKDGRWVILLSEGDEIGPEDDLVVRPPSPFIGKWDPEGTSWVTEEGRIGGPEHHLETTGFWAVGDGWLQPNEVTHYQELPAPPEGGQGE